MAKSSDKMKIDDIFIIIESLRTIFFALKNSDNGAKVRNSYAIDSLDHLYRITHDIRRATNSGKDVDESIEWLMKNIRYLFADADVSISEYI